MSMQLHELARFLPELEKPDFKPGVMVESDAAEPGVWTMPYANYSTIASDFMRAAYEHGWVLTDFGWPEWTQTDEAKALRDNPATLAAATPEQLARMLTVVIRQDRFVEGALLSAFETGLILGIVRRAAVLLEANKGP